jgi:hypothetical protein
MPTLSLTVSNEVAQKIQTAYGVSSLAEVKTAIVNQIKTQVIDYQKSVTTQTENAKVQLAETNREQAIETAVIDADSSIVVT